MLKTLLNKFKNKDPKALGVPNICFSLAEEDDEREEGFKKQRIERGFDDSETWSLDCTIAKFIIPRLERWLKIARKDKQSESLILDAEKLLTALKLCARGETLSKRDDETVKEGLGLFPKIFRALWW